MSNKIPWVEKYRPQSLKEMALSSAKVSGHRIKFDEELTNFIKNFYTEIKKLNEE